MSDMLTDLKNRLNGQMEKSVGVFENEMKGLRTGRASPQLLDPIVVNAYGAKMPLAQVGTVSVSGPLSLSISVWDQGLVSSVEKAIQESNLGLNPQTAGTVLRIQLPELTKERRKELAKTLAKYAEDARVAVRAIRRSGMDELKKAEKAKDISEDELRTHSEAIQKLTTEVIQKIDAHMKAKETELMTI